jgi:hypothetical protein
MAIGRISGQMLKSNLLRSGTDLAFETTLLVLDVTNSRVGVGTATPSRQLHINGTGAVRLPGGTTGERGTGAAGDVRYNSDTGQIEGYTNAWLAMTGGSTLQDADGNTGISVERAADQNQIHFFTETSGDVAHIRDDGSFEINNLKIADMTISSLTTNGDINITPNGTGSTVIKRLSVTDGLDLGDLAALNVGAISVDSVQADDGAGFDLTLADNQAAALEIKEGSNAYITFVTTDSSEQITIDKKTVVSTGVTFQSDTVDINGGAIDGAIIGANSAAAGTFTTATATSVQATNIKANDGSASITIADSTGIPTFSTGINAGDNNITNVGDIALDSISADGTSINVAMDDNQAGAFTIKEGANAYVTINTTDASELVTSNQAFTVATTKTFTTDTADINGGNIDGTIIGANSHTTGKFTTLEATSNLTVGGNLTVNGTTTSIDSVTLTIEDPLITLAKNNSGGDANVLDQGLLINRGSLDNVSMIWDESEDEFAMAVTAAEDGATAGNITIDSYAALHAGVTTVTDLQTPQLSAADGTTAATIANTTGIITLSGALSAGDNNITNVGVISVDTVQADGAAGFDLALTDNIAAALTIKEGSTAYMTFVTTDAGEQITVAKKMVVSTGITFESDTVDINGGAIDGAIIGANSAAAGTFTGITGTSLTLGEGNITNVGDIALDSISADGTDINISVSDNSATALTVKEGANVYLTFDSTNTAEVITSAQDFTVATTKTFTTDTADINGGNIDGTIIGGASAAAGTFTTATATNVQTGTVKANDGTAAITIADSTGAVVLTTATKVTGAFEVDGSTFIFNESSADVDFRFEGNGNANLLFGDAGNDRIGIKTATPAYTLDMGSATDAVYYYQLVILLKDPQEQLVLFVSTQKLVHTKVVWTDLPTQLSKC